MLANYYDLNKAHKFDDTFGQLYIGKNPTKARSSLLVLLFDFSGISTVNPDETKKELNDRMLHALQLFMVANKQFLGNPDLQSLLGDDGTNALQKVLVSLFIPVSAFLAHYILRRLSYNRRTESSLLESTSTTLPPMPVFSPRTSSITMLSQSISRPDSLPSSSKRLGFQSKSIGSLAFYRFPGRH